MPTLKPLPDCEGPKLDCFADDITAHDFKFLEYLGAGCHSNVFKAEIDSKVYFIHEYVHEPNYLMFPIDYFFLHQQRVPLATNSVPQHVVDSLRLHATSFNNECRAYGRLKELGREHLAVKAHGYLSIYLNKQVQEQVNAAFQKSIPGTNRTARSLMGHDPSLPIMAIVKDWIPNHRTCGIRLMTREAEQRQIGHLPRMLRNLRQLHKCGIVVRDIKDQQYHEGQLVDFSHAWTVPHILGPEDGVRPSWTFASMAAWDLKCFQKILDRADESASSAKPPLKTHKLVAWPNDEAYKRLRPRAEMYGPSLPMLHYDGDRDYDMRHYPPYDPSIFSWRAVQKRKKHTKESIRGVSKKRSITSRGTRRGGKDKSKKH